MHLDPMLPTVVAVFFAVLVISVILKRFNQPHVVAYLVTGMILGPYGIKVMTDTAAIGRLGTVGVVLLLFFIGMEISPKRLLSN